MGSVHSKISGSASSRPRGWQHMLSPPLAPDLAQRAAALHNGHGVHAMLIILYVGSDDGARILQCGWAGALEKLRE